MAKRHPLTPTLSPEYGGEGAGQVHSLSLWERVGVRACAVLLLATLSLVAIAKDAPPAAADPALEARMLRIANELRCLVCQNETIAASNADLAVDLREQVRELLRKGQSDKQILEYMTDRYGDFVLYRPPLKGTTLLLWFGPALLLAGGAAILVTVLRRRSRMGDENFEPDELDVAEQESRR
jgi:cytochrome c-type biogenesis protein CcmH